MKYAHSITSLLLKLFLVGSSQIFCALWAQAQSSSLSEQGTAPEDSLSASPPWQQLLSDLSSSEDFEHVAWQDYEEDLEEMAQHPVNLNTATREELERMPFLTASQVEDILFYIYRYGQLKSLSELTLISSIGWYQRQLMSCFFYVADDRSKPAFPSLKNIAQYGKHEVMGMLKVPFYERKGDASGTDGYLGYPYKHGLRYQFRYGNSVKLGFVASQDAGEPFFGGRNTMGYDFYSFYLQVKNLGRWKNITLGRYRLNAGLGLILNNDFGFGKLSALTSLGRSSSCIIRGHSSRSSANYLQGAAATYTLLKGLELTGFLSYRQIDATLSVKDEIEDPSMTFEELRIRKSEDFTDLEEGKRVSWSVEYCGIRKEVKDPKGTTIISMKETIERSREFLEALKKTKEKNPCCYVKPKVEMKTKGNAAYKGKFGSLEEARASDKVICLVPARNGRIYELCKMEQGEFIAPKNNVADFSEIRAGFTPALPKIPAQLMGQIIAFFRTFMTENEENEALALIYWDKAEKRFIA